MEIPFVGPLTLSGFSSAWFFLYLIAIVGAVYHLSSRRVEFLELPDELLRAAGDLGDLGVRPSASPGADGRSSARSGRPTMAAPAHAGVRTAANPEGKASSSSAVQSKSSGRRRASSSCVTSLACQSMRLPRRSGCMRPRPIANGSTRAPGSSANCRHEHRARPLPAGEDAVSAAGRVRASGAQRQARRRLCRRQRAAP